MPSPTQRSLKHLREYAYTVAIVEKYNAFIKRRMDLFGFGDLLAIHPGKKEIAIIQTTTVANLAARETKARAIPELKTWLESGGKFFLHGWKKRGPRGKAKKWEVTIREITLENLQEPSVG